jgi:hypothetical protein
MDAGVGFFGMLAARTLGALPRLAPIVESRYEPTATVPAELFEVNEEAELRPRRPAPQNPPPQMRARTQPASAAPGVISGVDLRVAAVQEGTDVSLLPQIPRSVQATQTAERQSGSQHAAESDASRSKKRSLEPSESTSRLPDIVVHIGRVDVRAVLPPTPPPATRTTPRRTAPSLEAHLRRRDAELR